MLPFWLSISVHLGALLILTFSIITNLYIINSHRSTRCLKKCHMFGLL